jgi:hypothetical protein
MRVIAGAKMAGANAGETSPRPSSLSLLEGRASAWRYPFRSLGRAPEPFAVE